MLSLEGISLETAESEPPRPLLDNVSLRLRRGQLVGVIGPSGCGKSTLLKLIAGLSEPTGGLVRWDGRDLATEGDLLPHELGYVPQFSLSHGLLTVRECVDYAARLRVRESDPAARDARVDALLATTGLEALADRQARVLSGGQRRRLSLAIEMVSSPSLLLCDEVTSGLDPGSAHDILSLLHDLSRADGGERRVVINVTHTLADLPLYDRILVLFEGRVVFFGAPEHLAHYFRLENPDDVFARLGTRRAEQWRASWVKHGPQFAALLGEEALPEAKPAAPASEESDPPADSSVRFHEEEAPSAAGPFADLLAANAAYEAAMRSRRERASADDEPPAETAEGTDDPLAFDSTVDAPLPAAEPAAMEAAAPERSESGEPEPAPVEEKTGAVDPSVTPGPLAQFGVILERRLLLFVRDRAQLGLQLALILGFPCLVVIFALKGLPDIQNMSLQNNLSIVEQFRESANYMTQAFKVGGLVSGLLLFQIILLALMGSNNSALEIAGERNLFESEKLAGLSSASYVGAKCVFLALLVTAQAVWMVLFVHLVCHFPGDLFGQIALLWLADAALTAVCLAFSSLARTSQQASLISIYFVGFQLPLSGAVLALPDWIAHLTRPFIAAYWAWSGTIQTMKETRFYDLILTTTKTDLAAMPTCFWVLLAHVILGVGLAYLGSRRSQWE